MNVKKIAELLEGKYFGNGETIIFRVASLEAAQSGEISFVEKNDLSETAQTTNADCLIIPENFNGKLSCSYIKVKNPKLAFAKVAEKLHAPNERVGIHKTAVIASTAEICANVFIGAFVKIGENSSVAGGSQICDGVKIGDNVTIGKRSIVYPNCVIYDNVSIGKNVVFHAGVVVGADGFGFVRDAEERYVKFPQIGTVVIEDEVEIGANSCIDRGALGETRISKGTKIDNLVQIAHNVQIGERVIIASQTGISGSTIIEDDCVIGGQVGMGDHARVKTGAIIGSQAGVLPGKIVRAGVWWGTPVQLLDEYKRQNAHVKGLERLHKEVKKLKEQINALQDKVRD
ncbi:MAG: UDP-3-O-(3-hydroxymyristoyl)glucosamine N-acyltransferase [Acidobacteriota bacterium]|nr:UDP-3-O-(3-hydroxymyristoyl)glucosamine N-acyltransferase [Acidobacteriota bacterium]